MTPNQDVIARAGKPYMELIPHREQKSPRTPGRFKGQIRIPTDFEQTPAEVIDAFEAD